MSRLSVIIITKNEVDNIRACLESVQWVDEIIVVDAGSSDGTAFIARKFTDKVYVHDDWPGFGRQKNRALEHASGDWVLSLDADERVPPALHKEILLAMSRADHAVYRIPRQSWFLGRRIRHSGWSPDYVARLFRRGSARFSDDLVHERLVHDASAGTLGAPLLHYSYRTLDQVLDKMNQYSTAGAANMHEKGRRGGLGAAIGHGLWTFLKTWLLRGGFLDGREGLILAIANAQGSYYRYLKLMYLDEQQRAKNH